jgi:hypothetical protein
MQFRSWARGEGELYSRKAARGRDARSGELNRKRQRTGNDFTDPSGARISKRLTSFDIIQFKYAIAGIGASSKRSCESERKCKILVLPQANWLSYNNPYQW